MDFRDEVGELIRNSVARHQSLSSMGRGEWDQYGGARRIGPRKKPGRPLGSKNKPKATTSKKMKLLCDLVDGGCEPEMLESVIRSMTHEGAGISLGAGSLLGGRRKKIRKMQGPDCIPGQPPLEIREARRMVYEYDKSRGKNPVRFCPNMNTPFILVTQAMKGVKVRPKKDADGNPIDGRVERGEVIRYLTSLVDTNLHEQVNRNIIDGIIQDGIDKNFLYRPASGGKISRGMMFGRNY